jgi:hypothetical protein
MQGQHQYMHYKVVHPSTGLTASRPVLPEALLSHACLVLIHCGEYRSSVQVSACNTPPPVLLCCSLTCHWFITMPPLQHQQHTSTRLITPAVAGCGTQLSVKLVLCSLLLDTCQAEHCPFSAAAAATITAAAATTCVELLLLLPLCA